MRSADKNYFGVFLICVALLAVAGTIGFLSGSMMPQEIKVSSVIPEKPVEVSTETPTEAPTVDEQLDELQKSIGTVVDIVKEVPRFFFLMGNKIFAPQDESPDVNEANVFSVVKTAR